MYYFGIVLQVLGTISALFGACSFDSEKLWFPLIVLFCGITIVGIGTAIRSGYVKN